MSAQERREHAEEMYWLKVSYVEAGFSEEQAMMILCRPVVQNVTNFPPEFSEWLTKMNLTMDKEL